MANTQQSQQMANAIRALAMDAVQQANSGHPGAPMGMADMAVGLWARHLKHNPTNPQWFDRDRFVLSNGHGSMLIYSLLHLTGYDLPMSELKNFRQLHSKTAGHPEVGITPGVETTTGPLGQGITNAVGFALAEKLLAAEFNRDGHAIVDHNTYAFLGDGCLMEGISHEAASLAGDLARANAINDRLMALHEAMFCEPSPAPANPSCRASAAGSSRWCPAAERASASGIIWCHEPPAIRQRQQAVPRRPRGADRRRIPGVVAERFEIVAVVAVEPFGRPEPHQPRTVLCHGENHFVRQSRVNREVGEMEVRDLSPQGQPAKQQQSGSKVFHRS